MRPATHRRLPLAAVVSAAALVLAATSAHALVLTEDAVWSGEVAVTEDVEVAAGATLRVAAGATISISPGVSITVRGRILVDGTAEERVLFTRSGGSGAWDRLVLADAAPSRIAHAIFELGGDEGDHKDYYDDTDADCQPVVGDRPPRDYHEVLVVLASDLVLESSLFRDLPGPGGEGDAIAIISDDPVVPGPSTAVIRDCQFIEIGQGVHTRYSYVLVEDSYFTGHRGDNDDIDLYGESDPPPYIRNNVMVDPDHDDMINPTRCSAIIEGNIIGGSDDHGIVLRDRCDPVLINNFIFDCASAGIAVQNTADGLILNNTIVDCGRGIRFFDHTGRWGRPYCLAPGSGRATIINTVIWNCPVAFRLQDTTFEGDRGSHIAVSYSGIQGGESRIDADPRSTVVWGEGNVVGAPGFVDPEAGDYRLAEGSVFIDAGTSEGAPGTDKDGSARPCGDGVDIGAYEHGGCSVTGEPRFRRGDVNADGSQDISDPVALLLWLFAGAAPPGCPTSADFDDSGVLEITDAIFGLAWLFTGGDAPPAPLGSCGVDPTPDALECPVHPSCG